ncbi:maleylacetoacetate isomerase [Chitinimonas sp. BJB300]|uniref:maleylacetoacetate isomerase n=1 Tax=Chitinimonas sp. BJB300 TaxID=1559339 RepID=UPI000C0D8DFE|nr:maleylacetoacetate isomerase [Chitinimonas sp. BJB300]PHV10679.1 maleylacetoacetate isomerase [Chitinimonas sp. BJB300]TSJ84496.1 maleylacetoacetate isomerase [Chitinimonas sp. BJB300]
MSRTLYTYFRSSAAWRVRIALALKGLTYEAIPIHLLRDGGQQQSVAYLAVNPQGLVPALIEDGSTITQSLAICEYLEERYPSPAILPADLLQKTKVRSLAYVIACDIHPINNLRVLQYLKGPMGQDQQAVDDWYRHWVALGLQAIEAELERDKSERFCVGSTVSLADICLVPQVFNARRFKLDLTPFPRVVAIDAHLNTLPAFTYTQPAKQADAE